MAGAKDYYSLPEEEIQDLIKRSQQGDQRAQLKLLEIFDNYLWKYINLLYYEKYDLSNYDLRTFINLFVPDPGLRASVRQQKFSPPVRNGVYKVVHGIYLMTRRYGDEEDIAQTVKMAFLHCISTYERRGEIPFSGFLYSYYKFILKKFVDNFLIDQNGRNTYPLIDPEQSLPEDETPVGAVAPPTDHLEEMLGAEKIDEFWVAGDTCYPPFDVLTIQERQLLRWRYEDGYKASEIAHRITEHPNTLREHFTRIRSKLREQVDEITAKVPA